MKFFEKLSVLFAVILASQFPLFVDQYDIRLQSHIEEAKYFVLKIDEIARSRNKSPEEYYSKFSISSDVDIQAYGQFMKDVHTRYELLLLFHEKILSYSPLLRPFIFIFSSDCAIALETLYGFRPGFLVSEAEIIWGILGGVIAYAIIIYMHRRKKK